LGRKEYQTTANQLERKRLPDEPIELPLGHELGWVEQVADEPATGDERDAEIERLRQQSAHYKDQWSLTAMELNSYRSEKTYERDDSFFVANFRTLQFKIRDWAKRHFSDGPIPTRVKSFITRDKGDMQYLAIDDDFADGFVHSVQLRFLMIEAFVWSFIVFRVMGSDGHIWAGSLKEPFGSIRKVLDPGKQPSFKDDG
jgi:hypothetical protein